MCSLEDTCLVYRAGVQALKVAQDGARSIMQHGGSASATGMACLFQLDRDLLDLRASPGGSADLLAGSIFLDSLSLAAMGMPLAAGLSNIDNFNFAHTIASPSFGELYGNA
jgi:triphosphoribosyl-dephospho-CoA synthase